MVLVLINKLNDEKLIELNQKMEREVDEMVKEEVFFKVEVIK